jgi:hypothetical protein
MTKKIVPLSNIDIHDKMRDIKNFVGVFSRNNTPYLKKNHSLILNLDDEEGSGTHWVALCKKKDGSKVLFFDSYGYPPPQEIVDIYKKNKNKLVYSNNEIQDPTSIMCGYYCMMFIREFYKGRDFYDFLYSFDINNRNNNEKILKLYFKL